MTSLLEPWFTEKDEEVVGASQSDPIGLEVIWAGFASRLFRTRVNSIANDLRGYSINLFHHWMVRKIRARAQAEPSWWKPPARRKFQEGDHPSFSRMLLVNFEKILLHSMHVATIGAGEGGATELPASQKLVDEEGLTGLSNARRQFSMQGLSEYRFILDEKEGEILKRQTQLGFSGRYRTPFTKHLGLLDAVKGHPVDHDESWQDVETLFASIPEMQELSEALMDTFSRVFGRDQNEFTSRSFAPRLGGLYVTCFGKRDRVERWFSKFWFEALALHDNDTKLLWDSLPEDLQSEAISTQELYTKAHSLSETIETQGASMGIERIVEVEPYLARMAWIFDGFLLGENSTRSAVETWVCKHWGQHPLRAVAPPDGNALISSLSGEGKSRLDQLLKMANQSADDVVQGLLEYHLQVSKYRAAEPWVHEVAGQWRRNVTIKKAAPDAWLEAHKDNRLDPQPWVNSYYSWGFVALAQAIRRGER